MSSTVGFDFERLEAFRVALDTVALLDELSGALPEGRSYLRDQLRRAANSVVLNLAEGAGEYRPSEKGRFYRMARRSATECAGEVMVCRRLGLVDARAAEAALGSLHTVIRMLVTLIRRCDRPEVPRAAS